MKKALFILIFAVVASMSLSAQSVQREQNVSGSPNVLAYIVDPNSIVYGRTFSEWDAEWQQWAYSIPVAKHPLFDIGNCSEGQSGMVWFLGGKFCRSTESELWTLHQCSTELHCSTRQVLALFSRSQAQRLGRGNLPVGFSRLVKTPIRFRVYAG